MPLAADVNLWPPGVVEEGVAPRPFYIVGMATELQDLVPHLALMLLGGGVASFGPGWWARREATSRWLAGLGGGKIALLSTLVVAVAGTGIYMLIRQVAGTLTTSPASVPAGHFLLFGILVGLPLSLPGVLIARYDARREARRARTAPATKDERRDFARRIAEQIRGLSPEAREVEASISGDGGRVLLFEGDLAPDEGDRLVEALRADLRDLGFKRVEGTGDGGAWWSRV